MPDNRTESKWVKDSAPFIRHETSLETRPDRFTGFLTPNEDFFVCNMTKTARVPLESYRLRVVGEGVERPLTLGYDDLLRLPGHTVLCYLECAGSMRQLYEEVNGEKIEEGWTMWRLGGVGMAAWTGVSLKTVLDLAGVRQTAVDVNMQGLDQDAPEGGVQRPIPIDKALHPDTLLAYAMNGEPLPPDHGFPLRAIVPGWVGANSVKWLGTITVTTEQAWVQRNTTMYVLKGDAWPQEEHAPAQGGPITTQNVKSSLSLPWNAHLSPGKQIIRGIARSPHAEIAEVVWSDDGETWQPARLIPPVLRHAWVRFEFEWDAPPGPQRLMTRATDAAGNTQPDEIPFNQEGYMFNQIYPHPVVVTTFAH